MDFGALIALGVSLGTGAGIIFDNVGLGMSLGLNAAVILQLAYEKKQGEEGAGIGLMIAIGGLLSVILISIISA